MDYSTALKLYHEQIIKKESKAKGFYYVFHVVAIILELSPFKMHTSYK